MDCLSTLNKLPQSWYSHLADELTWLTLGSDICQSHTRIIVRLKRTFEDVIQQKSNKNVACLSVNHLYIKTMFTAQYLCFAPPI